MAKKRILLGILAVLGLVFVMTVIGCDLGGYTYTFDNQSSYPVTVICSDLDPASFTVSAGQTKTATSSQTTIQITYSPANLVNATSSKGKFTFTNK